MLGARTPPRHPPCDVRPNPCRFLRAVTDTRPQAARRPRTRSENSFSFNFQRFQMFNIQPLTPPLPPDLKIQYSALQICIECGNIQRPSVCVLMRATKRLFKPCTCNRNTLQLRDTLVLRVQNNWWLNPIRLCHLFSWSPQPQLLYTL